MFAPLAATPVRKARSSTVPLVPLLPLAFSPAPAATLMVPPLSASAPAAVLVLSNSTLPPEFPVPVELALISALLPLIAMPLLAASCTLPPCAPEALSVPCSVMLPLSASRLMLDAVTTSVLATVMLSLPAARPVPITRRLRSPAKPPLFQAVFRLEKLSMVLALTVTCAPLPLPWIVGAVLVPAATDTLPPTADSASVPPLAPVAPETFTVACAPIVTLPPALVRVALPPQEETLLPSNVCTRPDTSTPALWLVPTWTLPAVAVALKLPEGSTTWLSRSTLLPCTANAAPSESTAASVREGTTLSTVTAPLLISDWLEPLAPLMRATSIVTGTAAVAAKVSEPVPLPTISLAVTVAAV